MVDIDDKEIISMKKECEARDYQSPTIKRPHVFEDSPETIINPSHAKDSILNKWIKNQLIFIKINQIEIDYSEIQF